MELIRDVATELDIDVLCHKILINVCLLTYADRGSLFLARGPPDKRYLVAKLFDVTVDTGELILFFIFILQIKNLVDECVRKSYFNSSRFNELNC